MKCRFQNCECRYQKNIDREQTMQTKSCNECELYDPYLLPFDGCFKPAKKIAVAILILILLLI